MSLSKKECRNSLKAEMLRLHTGVHYKSVVSVVFDFNASHSNESPVFPTLLAVDLRGMGKNVLLVNVICAFLIC